MAVLLMLPVFSAFSRITVKAYSGNGYYDDPYILSYGILSDQKLTTNSQCRIYPQIQEEFYDSYLGETGYNPVIEEIYVYDPGMISVEYDNYYGSFIKDYDSIALYSNSLTGQTTLCVLYCYYFDSYGTVYYRADCRINVYEENSGYTDPGSDPGNGGWTDPGYGYSDNYYTSYVISNISVTKDSTATIDLGAEIETAATGYINPTVEYSVEDNSVAVISEISADGLTAKLYGQSAGQTTLVIKYTYDHGTYKDCYTCYVSVYVTDPKLSANKVMINIYNNDPYGDGASAYFSDTGITVTGVSDSSEFEYKCGNKKIQLSFYKDYSVDGTYKVYLSYSGKKKGTYNVKIFVDGKVLKLKVKFYEMYLKYNSKSFHLGAEGKDPDKKWDQYMTNLILAKGDTTDIKLAGKPSGTKVTWSTSNKKVATVTKSGKVKAVGYGDADITVQVGNETLTYMLSVTTKTCADALYYAAKHYGDTYSQEKRMSEGYYDCSSYVWRSYNAAGKTIGGNSNWAPTAADLCKWCDEQGYVLKSADYGDLRAGDLAFETGADNGRYLGIYHVDLYIGHGWFATVKGAKFYEYEPVFARPYK